MTGNGNSIEWSHERVRSVVRVDGVPALPTAPSDPIQDPETGRFLPGNRAHRRRQLKARAEGIATMNPATVPSWMRPHVVLGAPYTRALLAMLEGKPALHPLAGDTSDAHVMYRATLALGIQSENPKERASLLSEARGWLREHRTALATLSALAGDLKLPSPDPSRALADALAEDDGAHGLEEDEQHQDQDQDQDEVPANAPIDPTPELPAGTEGPPAVEIGDAPCP